MEDWIGGTTPENLPQWRIARIRLAQINGLPVAQFSKNYPWAKKRWSKLVAKQAREEPRQELIWAQSPR